MTDTARSDESLDRQVVPGTAGRVLRSGVAWTLGGQWVSYLVQVATIVVLARLLTPDDFGLVAMVLAVTAVVDQFRTMGLSQAVLQRERLSWVQMDGLFWINGLVGVLLAAAIAGAGPLLAAFYGRDELVAIATALGVGYLVNGFAVQHQALLSRKLRFAVLARRAVVARVAASVVAITAAAFGAGYWALVLQQITTVVFGAVVVWAAVRWLPGRPRRLRETMPLLRFGVGVSAAALMNTVARQTDNIIIGKVLGADALGIYSRAYTLLMLPIRQLKDPIGVVVVPVLSAVNAQPDRYRRVYTSALAGVSHLGLPLVVVLAAAAEPLILTVLGDQWRAAVPVFQLLAVASLCQVVSATTGWLFVSSGRSDAYAAWAAASSMLTVASFIIGVRWGIEGVAAAYGLGQLALTVPAFMVACRGTAVRLGDVFRALARPLAVSLAVGACVLASQAWLPHDLTVVVQLLLALVSAGTAWAATMALWPAARAEVLTLVRWRRTRAVSVED